MPETLEEFMNSKLFTEWLYSHSYKDIHDCYLCPEIQEEIQLRYKSIKDIPVSYTEVDHYINDLREICDYCWCPHFGGKLWWKEHSKKDWKCIYG